MNSIIRFFLLGSLLLPSNLAAQSLEQRDHIMSQTYRAAKRSIDDAMDRFWPELDSYEAAIMGTVEISVDRYDWNLYGVRAVRRGSERSIHFPMGFLIANLYVVWGMAANELAGHDKDLGLDYIHEISDVVKRSVRATNAGQRPPPMPSYGEFVRMSEAEWRRLATSEQYMLYVEAMMGDGLAFILAHEIGHHVQGHLDGPASSLQEELSADNYAVGLSINSGFNPILAFTPFLLFAAIENDTGVYDGTSTHPPGLCRVVMMLRSGSDAALREEGFMEYLTENNLRDEWFESQAELAALPDEHGMDCPESRTR
ncbi:hypothetical protein KUV62_21685 [Salipiger bermudensis]|uniref:hypothetical protein n=1 Tax=Salipiger bermudensis TaxID=344736 RepID=UPI001C99C7C9|nr:hypothetical protein [Salipiger bermudensis]MBY6006550.1 hypothetical protein [Salipiger bermudensis]